MLSAREQNGEFHTLYEDLRKDEAKFCDYFRMNYKTFDKLLDLLKNKLQHPIQICEQVYLLRRDWLLHWGKVTYTPLQKKRAPYTHTLP